MISCKTSPFFYLSFMTFKRFFKITWKMKYQNGSFDFQTWKFFMCEVEVFLSWNPKIHFKFIKIKSTQFYELDTYWLLIHFFILQVWKMFVLCGSSEKYETSGSSGLMINSEDLSLAKFVGLTMDFDIAWMLSFCFFSFQIFQFEIWPKS